MIVALVRFNDLDEVVPVPLALDHPARVGTEHMPIGKVPIGAATQIYAQDCWRDVVAVTRVRAFESD